WSVVLCVVPKLGQTVSNRSSFRNCREITERDFVFGFDPRFCLRRVHILEPSIWIGDLDSVIVVYLRSARSRRIIEAPGQRLCTERCSVRDRTKSRDISQAR